MKTSKWVVLWLLITLGEGAAVGQVILNGAGATFPEPLYQKWIKVYKNQETTRLNYLSSSSSSGVKQLLSGKVDFGATDVFLTDMELQQTSDEIVHIPTCVGAVVIIYNLPGNPNLNFTPELLADVFMGKVTDWSDRRIKQINPEFKFPQTAITVIHRSDGSGTSHIFTDYLNKVSKEWAKKVGSGTNARWPAGLGLESNSGIAEFVKKIPGSIGYVELSYAEINHFKTASIENSSGNFIKPTQESVSSAAIVPLPDDLRIMLTNTHAVSGYPISSFTYIILNKNRLNKSPEKKQAMIKFLWWITHEGQQYTKDMHYAPLSPQVIQKSELIIDTLSNKRVDEVIK